MFIHVPDDLAALVPDLERFISAMVHKLHRNRHKGKWEDLNLTDALARLHDEARELEEAICQRSYADILMEGADVANFALIIASVALNNPHRGPRDGVPTPSGRAAAMAAAPWAFAPAETPKERKDEGGPCARCLEMADIVGVAPPDTCHCGLRTVLSVAPDALLPVDRRPGAVNRVLATPPSAEALERRLSDLRRLSHVGRWQVVPTIRQQTTLEHIGATALLAHMFWRWAKGWAAAGRGFFEFDYADLMRAAVCHDVDEALTSDLPSPFKKALTGLDNGRVEQIARAVRLDIVGDHQEQGRIGIALKWLDTLDAAMFLAEERAMGNERVRAVALDLEAKAQNLAAMLTPHPAGGGVGEGVAFMFTTAALKAAIQPVSLADPRPVYLGERQ